MIPASIRNKNPGAQYPGKSAKKFGSTTFETLKSKDGVHKIATFPTDVHGAAAQFDLLHSRYCGMTIEKAIEKWCGGYYATTYLKVLEDRTGVKSSDTLTKAMVQDHGIAIPLAKAMAWQEAGRDYPISDELWLQAHVMAFQPAEAPGWNPRNDVPTPKPETRLANTVRKVQNAAAVVGGSVTAGGVAVKSMTDTLIPSVPPGITDTLTNLGAWSKLLPRGDVGVYVVGACVFGTVALAAIMAKRFRA